MTGTAAELEKLSPGGTTEFAELEKARGAAGDGRSVGRSRN